MSQTERTDSRVSPTITIGFDIAVTSFTRHAAHCWHHERRTSEGESACRLNSRRSAAAAHSAE